MNGCNCFHGYHLRIKKCFVVLAENFRHYVTKDHIVKGISGNYRKETLRYHDKSEKHIIRMNRKSALENPSETFMAKSIVKSVEKRTEIFEALFNTAYYIAIENEAYAKFPELLHYKLKMVLKLVTIIKLTKLVGNFAL
jgi:hypothetical protein